MHQQVGRSDGCIHSWSAYIDGWCLLWGFYWDKQHNQKQQGEAFFQSTIKGNQSKNSRQNLGEKSRRNAAFWLAPCGLLRGLSYRTQDHYPRSIHALPAVSWALLHQPLTKRKAPLFCLQANLVGGGFSQLRFCLPKWLLTCVKLTLNSPERLVPSQLDTQRHRCLVRMFPLSCVPKIGQ